jgi:uncharacterized RDD family membrane protein YckC
MDKYQTFWQRLVAALIDGLIFLPLSYLASFFYQFSDPKTILIILVFDQALFLIYSIYMHGKFGQTIGKWIVSVKVLSLDETKLSMQQALLRDVVPISLSCIYIFVAINPILSGLNPESKAFYQALPVGISSLGIAVVITEILSMLTNAKRRSAFDFIAGSVVVKQPNPSFKQDA